MTTSIDRDLAFAIAAARGAARRAMSLRGERRDEAFRWDGKTLGDVCDQACDGYLHGLIDGRYPDDGLLSEETKDTPERLSKERVWIVDPLDGTKEYAQRRDDWAVHVALATGGRPSLGAVALPSQGRVAWAVCEPGQERAGMDGAGELVRGDSAMADRPRVAVSRSHTPPWVEAFTQRMGGETRPAGSVGNKVAMLLLGEADLYVHKVGLKEWDTCAPEVIARALGWHVSRLDGSEHVYNRADPRNHELIVCRPAVKDRVVEAVAACLAEVGA